MPAIPDPATTIVRLLRFKYQLSLQATSFVIKQSAGIV
jgi:hypothetical protein